MLKAGGAGCITGASNITSVVNAQVYANAGLPAADAAQDLLSAMRQVIAGCPLIPGLKSLVAGHTGDPSWANMRPPQMSLSAEAAAKLFIAFDACGFVPPRQAEEVARASSQNPLFVRTAE